MEQGNKLVTKQMVRDALQALGVTKGDTILTHSSFKSFGPIENGAQTIVDAMLETVGECGTVVFPTLCSENWDKVYENWHLNAKSDVGYLTNYFRMLPGACRSNQATHSVAAMGENAKYITETHGESGLRYGIYGDTPFAADSPWEKLYGLNAKVIFAGVGIRKCTFRHYVEYKYMEKCLEKAKKSASYESLKRRVWCYERFNDGGVWPHINNAYVQGVLEKEGKIKYATCGGARLILVEAKDFVDCATRLLEAHEFDVLSEDIPNMWYKNETIQWLEEVNKL